jgi:phosphoribosyl 1,2-cyclic phosphodiesterase
MCGFCPLASGSKGNCIYLGTKKTKVLIDAGISGKQIEERLLQIGVNLSEIEAVLVSHEHMDHIAGLKVLAKKNILVLANSETAKGIYSNLGIMPRFKIFTTEEPFQFGDIKIKPFSILHDTLDPVGFIIEVDNIRLGICTDVGFVTSNVIENLKGCDYLYIEANHQPSMVHASSRSLVYKQRVLGRQGHLSNGESIDLLKAILNDRLKHVHMAHLSSECNSPELVKKMMSDLMKETNCKADFSIAYQERISKPIYW